MRPVCAACKKEMRCRKNGIFVAIRTLSSCRYYGHSGDKYTCPDCGTSVIVGFGQSTHADITDPNRVICLYDPDEENKVCDL